MFCLLSFQVKQRKLILYWLLLLIPTLVIGILAISLLRHEQARINQAALTGLRQSVVTVAGNIAITVGEVQTALTQQLSDIPEPELAASLEQWERRNPLIRNVFVWDPDKQLVLPDPDMPATAEEARFVRRYDGLFSGRTPWRTGSEERALPPAPVAQPGEQQWQAQRELWSMANFRAETQSRQQTVVSAAVPESRWMPWFSENQLFLLGWTRPSRVGRIRGVEIEMMTLLSRLIALLPENVPASEVYAILDGHGRVLHQTGSAALAPEAEPLVSASVGPSLPHFQVAVYSAHSGSLTSDSRGFLLVSGLLVAIFMAVILSAGSLLLRQARSNYLDALRKTSFVSNVSHELKTPLTSIRMYAELLGEGRARDAAKRRRYLDVIIGESQRLTRLVNNVLDFSRLEQGRKTYRSERLDLADTVRSILDRQHMRLEQAQMHLHCRLHTDSAWIEADRDAVEQIILNLIDNAVKYAADGKELRVEIHPGEDRHRLVVEDAGPGIPSADTERIFEKFHRLDDSLTARQPGSGLGLAIARIMARDMGGDLVCDANRDDGARFILSLPARRD